jgi:hypothetical protein
MDANSDTGDPTKPPPAALDRLCQQLLAGWRDFPEVDDLRDLLGAALMAAAEEQPETITVMNPVSRPMTLRLHALVSDADLDSFYHQEWAELAVSATGRCFLVYRRSDGGDYAVEWSSATSVPATVMGALPPLLARAMYEQDDD